MPYTIVDESCIRCNKCVFLCPTGAIQQVNESYLIDLTLCNQCQGYYDEPRCVISCPSCAPVPLQAKKGRYKKVAVSHDTILNLFSNGKNNTIASALVIWEVCNSLAQRQSLAWESNEQGDALLQREVKKGKGKLTLQVKNPWSNTNSSPYPIEAIDLRSTCMHLIYAAYITTLDKPWEQEFTISDRQIEEYLGLNKRRDLNKVTKLSLIKLLAQQPCWITTQIDWPQQGQIPSFSIPQSQLWHLLDIEHHFQEDDLGHKHLIGLTFKVRAGLWAKYFLNKQAAKEQTGFYQYSILPKSLLSMVMGNWQQHEGAVRMILWLLFKIRLGQKQPVTISTLMRIAYGEEKLAQAKQQPEERRRLLWTFERDLECLNSYGLKPHFDPVTYPPQIQPQWVKLTDIPDDPEQALEYWVNDANIDTRLTSAQLRSKWALLMNARILQFDLPPEWEQKSPISKKKHP